MGPSFRWDDTECGATYRPATFFALPISLRSAASSFFASASVLGGGLCGSKVVGKGSLTLWHAQSSNEKVMMSNGRSCMGSIN